MKSMLTPIVAVYVAATCVLCVAHASDTNTSGTTTATPVADKGLNLAELFSLTRGLEINPKVVTATGGNGTTVGIDYKFERGLSLETIGSRKETDVAFAFKSGGLILAEPAKTPNNTFTHTLRLSLINLWPSMDIRDNDSDSVAAKANSARRKAIAKKYDAWSKLALMTNRDETHNNEMTRLVESATEDFRAIGPLRADADARPPIWNVTSKGVEKNYNNALRDYRSRPLFLSADFDADVEHDQTFTNVQFVGSAQIRGKVLSPIFDWPFSLIRRVTSDSDGEPKNWLNRAGGPYFWGGIGYVDASENDARQALTTEHSSFARAHAGVSYRTEIFGTTEANAVALELSWRYYYEINAPGVIKAQHLDDISYFKATFLLPKGIFIEYTDGKLPVDVAGGSTVSVGWRHNF
jgi:hypothetical protein